MFHTRLVRNLVIGSLLGNLLGDLDVFIYIRFFIPMGDDFSRLFSTVNQIGAALFYSTGFVCAFIYLRPVDRWLFGDDLPGLSETARRRALNFPVACALFWGALWASGGPFFYIGLHLAGVALDEVVIIHVALSVVLGGTVSVMFVYFLMDWAVRRWLAEKIFAGGPVVSVPGVFRVGIRSKMTLYYFAVVVMPLVIISGSIFIGTLESGARTAEAFSALILPLTLSLCAWGIMVGLTFAFLISQAVTDPVVELEEAMERAEGGDLEARLRVVSVDEIGRLQEGFNDMLRGLQERDFIKETFGRYVTRQVSDAVLSGRLRLGGELREVTILFCDIRDFTAMSERLAPEDVVEFLNNYFCEMVDVVLESGGTLDKFIGDAFLAVYGAPLEVDDHCLRAARAAMSLKAALVRFNDALASRGWPPIRIGISIHTGLVVAGNIGSQKRMEYTVIGDTVNLASRIEGLNRRFGTDVLISEASFRRVESRVTAEAMEPVMVKGKSQPVRVYRLAAVSA